MKVNLPINVLTISDLRPHECDNCVLAGHHCNVFHTVAVVAGGKVGDQLNTKLAEPNGRSLGLSASLASIILQ